MASGGSGVNAYWPGFVDALTNVVIAMIFVVVALAISLTFAAQMMGKKMAERIVAEQVAKAVAASTSVQQQAPPPPGAARGPADGDASSLAQRTVIAVRGNESASAPVAAAQVRSGRSLLMLSYAPGALTLDSAAAEQLRKAMGSASPTQQVELVGTGPAMSASDNQRAAYLRVMAVRNQLLEMGYGPQQIQMRIDTERESAQPQVRLVIKE